MNSQYQERVRVRYLPNEMRGVVEKAIASLVSKNGGKLIEKDWDAQTETAQSTFQLPRGIADLLELRAEELKLQIERPEKVKS